MGNQASHSTAHFIVTATREIKDLFEKHTIASTSILLLISISLLALSYFLGRRGNSHIMINSLVQSLQTQCSKTQNLQAKIRKAQSILNWIKYVQSRIIYVHVTIIVLGIVDRGFGQYLWKVKILELLEPFKDEILKYIFGVIVFYILLMIPSKIYQRRLKSMNLNMQETKSQANQLLELLIEEFGELARQELTSYISNSLKKRSEKLEEQRVKRQAAVKKLAGKDQKITKIQQFYERLADKLLGFKWSTSSISPVKEIQSDEIRSKSFFLDAQPITDETPSQRKKLHSDGSKPETPNEKQFFDFEEKQKSKPSSPTHGQASEVIIDSGYIRNLKKYFSLLKQIGQEVNQNKDLDEEISVDDIQFDADDHDDILSSHSDDDDRREEDEHSKLLEHGRGESTRSEALAEMQSK